MYNKVFPYCSSCKAKKNLCGLGYCPIIKNLKSSGLELRMVSGEAETDTPPGIFVGNYGYPEVLAGPTALFNQDVIWMQLGVENMEGAKLAEDNSIKVIMNKCIMEEHKKMNVGVA